MISDHDEIEVKMPADKVDVEAFRSFCFGHKPVRYVFVEGPDDYWEQGPNAVRHRRGDLQQLTVKRRKSESSTRDRLEVDLDFSGSKVRPEDVQAWLKAAGFTMAMTLTKRAHIFEFQQKRRNVTVVLYDVWRDVDGKKVDPRRYVEVEIEKGSDVSVEAAKRHLRVWVDIIQCEFDVGDPLNESLWEIYGNRRYQLVEGKTNGDQE